MQQVKYHNKTSHGLEVKSNKSKQKAKKIFKWILHLCILCENHAEEICFSLKMAYIVRSSSFINFNNH